MSIRYDDTDYSRDVGAINGERLEMEFNERARRVEVYRKRLEDGFELFKDVPLDEEALAELQVTNTFHELYGETHNS